MARWENQRENCYAIEQCFKTASRVLSKGKRDVRRFIPVNHSDNGPTSCYRPGLMNTTRRSKVWTLQQAVDDLLKTSSLYQGRVAYRFFQSAFFISLHNSGKRRIVCSFLLLNSSFLLRLLEIIVNPMIRESILSYNKKNSKIFQS